VRYVRTDVLQALPSLEFAPRRGSRRS
jgi:hypothetical protein